MPIEFTCSCGRQLRVPDEHAGRRVKCPACGEESTAPLGEQAVQPAEALEPKPSPAPAEQSRRPTDDEGIEDRPRRRAAGREDDEDDEDRPRRSRRRADDDDDDRPRRRRRREDDDEDDDRRREPVGTSGKATAALVLGFLSFCLGLLAAIPAIILALLSFGDIRRSRGRLGGHGAAVAGLILGCVSTLIWAVVVLFAVPNVRESAQRMQVQNDMKQMVLAMHNYNDANGRLPRATPAEPADAGKPAGVAPPPFGVPQPFGPTTTLSWRVELLPYLEYDNLYKQLRLHEPWDSPHNKALLTPMPKVFQHPGHPESNAQGLTYYRVFVGEHAPFAPGRVTRIPANFPDGLSNTILIVEAADPVPWTKPDELPYDPVKPLPRLGGSFRGGFVVGMGDGFARIVGPGVSERTLRNAIDPADGNVLGPDW